MNNPIKHAFAIAAILAASACEQPQSDATAVEAVTPPIPSAPPPAVPQPAPAVKMELPVDIPEPEPELTLCWQDYCPCENPVTSLDTTICRNARAGISMSDDQWSIGAEARDLKYAGDESNRQMNEAISDMKAGLSQ